MKYHVVSIKGTMAQAIVAANEYGIVLRSPSKHPRFNEVLAYVDHECLPELYRWFNEPCDFEARETEAGTLLWFDGAGQMYSEMWGNKPDADDKAALELVRALDQLHAADSALVRGLDVTCR